MTVLKFDLLAIGNALVDVLSPADEAFLDAEDARCGMKRGSMNLVSDARALELYGAMKARVKSSGGSAANTLAGFASFGGRAAYIGKVAADILGDVFRHDMKAQQVTFETAPLEGGASTGRCMILVSGDGQRTMNTFLGAAVTLGPADIDPAIVAGAAVTYLEGYLFDPVQAKAAFRLAAKLAHEAGRKVALTLSDAFCVGRHREDFLDLVANHVDILFANEAEIISLYETATFEEAVGKVRGKCDVVVLTRSAQGSVILAGAQTIKIAAAPVARVLDTTGAGDQYAAGFLYGFTQGRDLGTCGRLGSLAAAEVIGHMGPRPEISYAGLLKKAA